MGIDRRRFLERGVAALVVVLTPPLTHARQAQGFFAQRALPRDTTRTNFAFKQDPTEVGRGMLKWQRLLPAAYSAGVRHFYVEQESPFEHGRFDAIAASYAYLANQV